MPGHESEWLTRKRRIDPKLSSVGWETGARISQSLDKDIRTAVRRGVIRRDGAAYQLDCRTIEDYERDDLIQYLLAAMRTTWWERSQAIRAAARPPGFPARWIADRGGLCQHDQAAMRRGQLEMDGEHL